MVDECACASRAVFERATGGMYARTTARHALVAALADSHENPCTRAHAVAVVRPNLCRLDFQVSIFNFFSLRFGFQDSIVRIRFQYSIFSTRSSRFDLISSSRFETLPAPVKNY